MGNTPLGFRVLDPLTIYSRVAPMLFIPILFIIGLILFLIFRKNEAISRRIILIDFLFILFILISSGLIIIRDNHLVLKTKQFFNVEIPYSVHQLADDHFIQITGEAYFRKNFIFDRYASQHYDNGSYLISYQFLPLKNILGNYSLTVRVVNNRDIDASYFPDCASGSNQCQFNLTKEDINTIIKQYNVTKEFTLEPPYLKTTLCDEGKYKGVLSVNYTTKEVNVSDDQIHNFLLIQQNNPI